MDKIQSHLLGKKYLSHILADRFVPMFGRKQKSPKTCIETAPIFFSGVPGDLSVLLRCSLSCCSPSDWAQHQ